MKRNVLISIVVIGVTLFSGCVNQVELEKDATDAKISGTLFLSDAVTPAENTLVTIRLRNSLALVPDTDVSGDHSILAVGTASDGTYRFPSCPPGIYALDAVNADNNAVRIDSVIIDSNELTIVPPTVLDTLGSITGAVALSGDESLLNVFVLVFGSERYVQVREDGSFEINELPYGSYELKVLSVHPHYPEFRTIPVTVPAGTRVVLDTVVLEMTGTASPGNLHYTYNPLNRMVLLEWDRCESEEIIGYNVYRRLSIGEDSYGKIPINSELITDATSFIDSVVMCGTTYLYAVSAVSTASLEKKCPPCTVTTNCINYDIDSISFTDEIPRTLYWGENGNLNIICDAQGAVAVHEYAEDRQLLSKKTIPVAQPSAFTIVLKDSVLYLTRSVEDSIVFGYTYDGDSLCACNVRKKISRFCVRDTLLYALTYHDYVYNDINRLGVYDFHGNRLYELEESRLIMLREASDGNIYSSCQPDVYEPYWRVLRYDRTLPESTEIPSRPWIFLETSKLYRLYIPTNVPELHIADTNNTLIARVNVPFPSLYDWIRIQQTVINDRGEFAAIGANKVYILKPPK